MSASDITDKKLSYNDKYKMKNNNLNSNILIIMLASDKTMKMETHPKRQMVVASFTCVCMPSHQNVMY